MGFEGIAYIGTAGTEATTQLDMDVVDITLDLDEDYGETTDRGDSSEVPVETGDPVLRKYGVELKMLNDPDDANLQTILAAVNTGTPLAFRTKDHAAGKGFDGDVFFKRKHGMPLKGEQTLDFTVKPTKKAGRTPRGYV